MRLFRDCHRIRSHASSCAATARLAGQPGSNGSLDCSETLYEISSRDVLLDGAIGRQVLTLPLVHPVSGVIRVSAVHRLFVDAVQNRTEEIVFPKLLTRRLRQVEGLVPARSTK